jgi:23S rRNA pseudouridine1911/1915/1917 synthase
MKPSDAVRPREIVVPERGAGMRLDRMLAAWFPHRSRSALVRGIKAGQVLCEGQPLRASTTVRAGQALAIWIPGIAPVDQPPPFPDILWEDALTVAVAKPPGMMAHPAGGSFVWSLVGLAKERWPEHRIDLVHRLDRDTSGVLLLTKEAEANKAIKAAFKAGRVHKEYLAICRGHIPWEHQVIDGPIGPAGGVIRIQMGVREEGLPAHTEVDVLQRSTEGPPRTLVRCRIRTGRTHQIRVHLAHVGYSLLGDRLYGVPPDVFLEAVNSGMTEALFEQVGAPRHGLHAHRLRFLHPRGQMHEVVAPPPADFDAMWRGEATYGEALSAVEEEAEAE